MNNNRYFKLLYFFLVFISFDPFASEKIKIKNTIVVIEIDQTSPSGSTWDNSMFGASENIKAPDLTGFIAIPKSACNLDEMRNSYPASVQHITKILNKYDKGLCLILQPDLLEAIKVDGKVLDNTVNSYQITFQTGKIELMIGDQLYFELSDQDASTANDKIGRGSITFNGDRFIDGKLGSMFVRVEFIY